jgi:hypothetical protein
MEGLRQSTGFAIRLAVFLTAKAALAPLLA